MNREILRLAIPNILSNISVPLLSSIDTALMGQLSGKHIAAVGLGSMAFNLIYWNFGFLRMASTGLSAQAYGRNANTEATNVLGRALLVAFSIATLILLFQLPLLSMSSYLLNIKPNQYELIQTYFQIRIWAAPATLGLMAFFGWFFGMQNALFPLLLTILINLINMSLSYWMVKYKGYGIAGAAWGTLIAQYVGLLAATLLLCYRYNWALRLISWKVLLIKKELFAFLKISSDIFLRTLCLTLSFTFFYNRANAMPNQHIVAANVVLLQLVNWLSYGVDGFAFAAESLVGKYYGSRDFKNLNKAIRHAFIWGIGLGLLYLFAYYFFDYTILSIFIDADNSSEVLATCLNYLAVVLAFCLLAVPCYIFDGIFVGLTASKAMRTTMLLAFIGYLATFFLVGQYYANWGLWGSLIAFMVYRAVLQWIWWKRMQTTL